MAPCIYLAVQDKSPLKPLLSRDFDGGRRRQNPCQVHRLQLLHVLQQLGRQRLESEHVGEGKKLKTPPTQYVTWEFNPNGRGVGRSWNAEKEA